MRKCKAHVIFCRASSVIIKALVDYRTPPFYHKRGFVRRCFKSLFLFRITANFWCHYDDDFKAGVYHTNE